MANELERLAEQWKNEADATLRDETALGTDVARAMLQRDLANELRAALQQAQQPGAQAVAWRRWNEDEGDYELTSNSAWAAMYLNRGWEPLYTAPPPLPEGVSEEDVEAATMAYAELAVKYGYSNDVRTVGVDPECIRAALESYRARLAAKGGEVDATE